MQSAADETPTAPSNPTAAEANHGAPDWATLTRDIHCPLCGYNLRMLTQPRCPECGYRFTWPEVLIQLDLHPYLFEHHPERNIRSYLRTSLGVWRPRKFWRSLQPAMPSFPRRLVSWWLKGVPWLVLATLSFVLCAIVLKCQGNVAVSRYFQRFNSLPPPLLIDLVKQELGQSWYNILADHGGSMILCWPLVLLLPLLWPWLTFASLMIFRISMRRARIKPIHMLRCSLYSFDMLAWAMLLTVLALSLPWFVGYNAALPNNKHLYWLVQLSGLSIGVCIAVSAYRLWIALKLYLRFDHPLSTVTASQTIATMAGLALLSMLFPRTFYHLCAILI